jgi:SNF2 family DNA or RNA helicase
VIPLLETSIRQHQLDGITAIEQFDGRALIADEQGVGKSLTALGYIFKHNLFPAVIVTPASLKLNWVGEIKQHFPNKDSSTIKVLSGTKPTGLSIGEQSPERGWIYIINYDIMTHWEKVFTAMNPKIIVCDESAALKNPSAKRTKTMLRLAHHCDKFLAMTGTPLQNNPLELYPTIHMIFKGNCMKYHEFRSRYCIMQERQFGRRRALIYLGPRNTVELHNLLKAKCMLRRKANEVLTLPPYTRSTLVYEMTSAQRKEYESMENDFINWLTGTYPDRNVPRSEFAAILTQCGYLKRECAKWKIPSALDWIDTFLENNPDKKLLIFAIHKAMIASVVEHYTKKRVGIVSITGETKMENRQLAVDRIQNDPKTRLFIGNIHAAGTGLTMTRAAYTLFLELDFVPANHFQAERRNYRLGQEERVFWYYYVVKSSIEEKICRILTSKDNTNEQIIEGNFEAHASTFNLLKEIMPEKFKGF